MHPVGPVFCFAQDDVPTLKQKALAGDSSAEIQLGMKYAMAAPTIISESMKWFRMAADRGSAEGQLPLAALYDVKVSPQDPTEAVKWYTLAAKQGLKDAQFMLAQLYDQGRGVPQNDTEAAKWYTRAAQQGGSDAQYSLGEIYENGSGVTKNYGDALKWYLAAANQGQPEAEFKVGHICMGRDWGSQKARTMRLHGTRSLVRMDFPMPQTR